MHHLAKRVKAHYASSTAQARLADPEPHLGLPRARAAHASPDAEAVLREINGYDRRRRRAGARFTELEDDGSTACGCWIYSGVFADGVNQARRREPGRPRRRPAAGCRPSGAGRGRPTAACSTTARRADPDGKPWSERKKYVWWDEEEGKWTGYDVPDFPADKRAGLPLRDDAEGMDAIDGDDPFIMMADGRGWLYSPSGLLDGPLPTHYEPLESPVANAALPGPRLEPGGAALGRAREPVQPRSATRATRTSRRRSG